jgi:hypothetical protein
MVRRTNNWDSGEIIQAAKKLQRDLGSSNAPGAVQQTNLAAMGICLFQLSGENERCKPNALAFPNQTL